MTEITIPSLGIGMTEALLVRWLKQPGDAVAQDEPVAEIETDKATMDLVSPSAGELGPHLHEPGAVIPVGDVIVRVLGDDNGAGRRAAPAAEARGVRAAVAGDSVGRHCRIRSCARR